MGSDKTKTQFMASRHGWEDGRRCAARRSSHKHTPRRAAYGHFGVTATHALVKSHEQKRGVHAIL